MTETQANEVITKLNQLLTNTEVLNILLVGTAVILFVILIVKLINKH